VNDLTVGQWVFFEKLNKKAEEFGRQIEKQFVFIVYKYFV